MNSRVENRAEPMVCRPDCAVCCETISISSPIPGMADGKPAGVPCVQLDAARRCRLFGLPERPAVCASFRPAADTCGVDRTGAEAILGRLEAETGHPPSR